AAEQAMSLSRFLLGELAGQHDLGEPEGRARCIHESLPLMQAIPAGALRMQMVRELAEMVKLTADELTPLLQLQDQPAGPLVQQGRAPARAPDAPSAAPSPETGPPDFDGPPPDFDFVPPEYAGEGDFAPAFEPPSAGATRPPRREGRWRKGGQSWKKGRQWDEEFIPRDAPRRPVPTLPQR